MAFHVALNLTFVLTGHVVFDLAFFDTSLELLLGVFLTIYLAIYLAFYLAFSVTYILAI